AGAIAGILLGLVYGGLTYLGATTSTLGDYAGMGQAQLLLAIVNGLMGKTGVILLAVVVLLACMTTAIGLTSVA
ncbi:branched-chain amino acid transport system II carrier protein, partial [Klebsiella oxytoca]